MLLDKKNHQPKSLQATKEIMEKCTKAYGGCNIRLVVWILLKRPIQVKKEDAIAISGSVSGLGITKSMGRREKLCLRGLHVLTALSASLLDFIRRGAPSLCARSVPQQGEKRKQRGTLYETPSSSGADVASSTRRKSRKLLIPKHQLLLFSFQMSFTSRSGTHLPPRQRRCGAPSLPSTRLSLSPTLTERLRLIREGRESWRPDAGGPTVGTGHPLC